MVLSTTSADDQLNQMCWSRATSLSDPGPGPGPGQGDTDCSEGCVHFFCFKYLLGKTVATVYAKVYEINIMSQFFYM